MNIIGTGIDIASVKRLKDSIRRRPALENKIFTPGEIAYCRSKKNCFLHMAGRFAAKEAVYKALSAYSAGFYFRDIEIVSGGARPVISADCALASMLAKKALGYSLSIAHEEEYAVAYSVFWEN